ICCQYWLRRTCPETSPVQPVTGDACQTSDEIGGLPPRHTGSNELGHRFEPDPIGDAGCSCRGENECDLALGGALESLGNASRRVPDDLLECLSELATHRDTPLRERGRQGHERRGQPLRRFERNGGVRPGLELFPERRKRTASPRQVAEELVALKLEAA